MLSASEYLLKAENYALAARAAETMELRLTYIRVSAIYRNKALRAQLGRRADVLRRCPIPEDQLGRF